MPLWDWQFFVVTLIAGGALWMLLRRTILPARKKKPASATLEAPACAHCASNVQQQRQPSRTTTVPVVALNDLRRQRDARQHASPRH